MKTSDDKNQILVGEVWISPQHNTIGRGELERGVQPKVMAVLHHLALNNTRVISNEELLETVWEGRIVTHSSIQKSINALRSALAELDDSQEYITHFSKRGYQLVVPVVFTNTERQARVAPLKSDWIAPRYLLSAAVLFSFLVIVLMIAVSDNRTSSPSIEGFSFVSGSKMPEGGSLRVHIPEPHAASGKLAYIQGMSSTDGQASQLMIHNPQGDEWLVSVARGAFVDLAWSPSGRNLAALDVHNVDGGARLASFYEQGLNDYYTLHIFTLDFKGERLLEKNLLGHWQGQVTSVSWWDENTVEFVATQGPKSVSERYRYNVPTQQLTKMPPVKSGMLPLASSIFARRTALLSKMGEQFYMDILDESQAVTGSMSVASADLDISWLSDGSGIIFLDKHSQSAMGMTLNGESFSVQLPAALHGQWTRLRFAEKGVLFGALEHSSVSLAWQIGEQPHLAQVEIDAQLDAATSNASGTEWVYALEKRGETGLYRLQHAQPQKLSAPVIDGRISALLWSAAEQLIYSVDRQIWRYSLTTEKSTVLFSASSPVAVLSVDQTNGFAWVIRAGEQLRNLWQLNLKNGNEKQLTFGNLGSAVADSSSVYFQYVGQAGFWRFSIKNASLTRVDAPVPKNSNLLHAAGDGLYFVVGGKCDESDIFYYDFTLASVKSVTQRSNRRVQTVAFHPQVGALQNGCESDQSEIVKLN